MLIAGHDIACTAEPSTRPVLRTDITVTSDVVRVGDFIGSGSAAFTAAMFRAPDMGETGSVPVSHVVDALRARGIIGVETRGATEISVHRASRMVSAKDIEGLVASAIAAQANVSDEGAMSITFDRELRNLHVDPTIRGDLRIIHASYSPNSQRFEVALDFSADVTPQRARLRYTGTAFESAPVAVLTRALARGEQLRAGDVTIERRPRAQVGADMAASIDVSSAVAARRALRAGQPLRMADLMKPEVVRQNETVTITYEMPGLSLTIRGKALDAGGEGDVINVLNAQSKRTLQATVLGPGRVSVASTRTRLIDQAQTVTGALAARATHQRTE
jgi:flagella basal body P-ring formation protein FlgA